MIPSRRALLTGAGASLIAAPLMAEDRNALPLVMNGAWRQGGYAFGRTAPRALIFIDGEALTTASAAGLFVIGFDRDASASVQIEARDAGVTEFIVKPITAKAVLDRLNAVIMKPRPFIKADGYIGPCRRRRDTPDYAGPYRRGSDASRSNAA